MWELVEFRKYTNSTRFHYCVADEVKSEKTFEEMQTQLELDCQARFGMTEQQMDASLLTLPYTLKVQGIDKIDELILDVFPYLYAIRLYPKKEGKKVYKINRRGVLTDMDATQTEQEIESVNADLQEIKDRGVWRERFQNRARCEPSEVLPYLQNCRKRQRK